MALSDARGGHDPTNTRGHSRIWRTSTRSKRGQSRLPTHPQATQEETQRYIHNWCTHTKTHLVTHRDAAGCGNSHNRSEHTQGGNCSDSHTHSDATTPGTHFQPQLHATQNQLFLSKHQPQLSLRDLRSLEKQRPSPTPARPCAPFPHAKGGPCPRPPTVCRRRWARNSATSQASSPSPGRCGRRTCPSPSGRTAL